MASKVLSMKFERVYPARQPAEDDIISEQSHAAFPCPSNRIGSFAAWRFARGGRGPGWLLAHSLRVAAAAGLHLFHRVPCRDSAARAADRAPRITASRSLPAPSHRPFRLAHRRISQSSDRLLARHFRSRFARRRVERRGAVAAGPARLRECDHHADPVDALHVDRECRPALVRLRMGNSTSRNWLPQRLSLSAARWPVISAPRAASRCPVAFSLAHLSHHARRGTHQAARRPVLARPDLPLLPLRDAANSESAKLVAALPAALVPQVRRLV